ncbi:hypothetical protein A1332_07660 [Methylomonas methanica]|uniref:Uncharacterized protein n=1 Tax=Methylomonas methanica TaxID=421 RepID=A0A177MSK6_METMH|nr:hypothetical protein A1332_07660 [Methylomonas methanica]
MSTTKRKAYWANSRRPQAEEIAVAAPVFIEDYAINKKQLNGIALLTDGAPSLDCGIRILNLTQRLHKLI